jgi:hypothetical protein
MAVSFRLIQSVLEAGLGKNPESSPIERVSRLALWSPRLKEETKG